MKNNTDYNFPQDWGLYSPEQKQRWFVRQRVWKQVNRQHRAGMWEQWEDEDGTPPMEAWDQATTNEYRYDP